MNDNKRTINYENISRWKTMNKIIDFKEFGVDDLFIDVEIKGVRYSGTINTTKYEVEEDE